MLDSSLCGYQHFKRTTPPYSVAENLSALHYTCGHPSSPSEGQVQHGCWWARRWWGGCSLPGSAGTDRAPAAVCFWSYSLCSGMTSLHTHPAPHRTLFILWPPPESALSYLSPGLRMNVFWHCHSGWHGWPLRHIGMKVIICASD